MTIGEKIGSARKKIDGYLKSHKIETVFTPAVSLFGVVQFSLGEVKIDPNPDTWTKIDEAKIEEIVEKTAGISLQEYRELLRSEISSKNISEIKTQIEKIEEYIRSHKEYPLLSPDEFERMQENKFLLKYKNFIGRDEELQKLRDFVNGEDKIGFIVGRGGVGKTKLALKFAKQMKAEGEWDVYFVNRYADFHLASLNDKTLLILDEAWGYKPREKIVDFVLNRSDGNNIKLLMIDRPISEGSIKSDLKIENVHIAPIKLEKGDIAIFLRENFEDISEDKIREIEGKCEGSFVYASFFAEHLREKGMVGDLKEVLAQRVEKYIMDIKEKIGKDQDAIKNAICQISLVTPIDWFNKDREYLEKAFGFKSKFDLADEILNAAYDFPTEFLLYSDHNPSGFLIKPDPVDDYLKAELIKDGRSEDWIRRLIPYMPFRLSLNIITISESSYVSKDDLFEILAYIWRELNSSGGKTPEYFSALVLFTGNFRSLPFFSLDELNLSTWIECYNDISKSYLEEKATIEPLAVGLFNAMIHYGKAEKFEETKRCLSELLRLYDSNPEEKTVRETFAKGLVNAIGYFGSVRDLDNMRSCLKELRNIYESHSQKNDVIEKLAMGLFSAACHYGPAGDLDNMRSCLKELRSLHNSHPDNEVVREHLAKGLANATSDYGSADNPKMMEKCLSELRSLHNIQLNEKSVTECLALGLNNAAEHYSTVNSIDKMERCLEELRNLYTTNTENKAVRELFAKCLYNAANNYRIADQIDRMEGSIDELCSLYFAHSMDKEVREELAKGLYNGTVYYTTANDIEKLGGCLDELRCLHDSHPEDKEVRERLVMGLYNAAVSRSGVVGYGDLILLYKIRFDLPESENKQENIKQVESLFIEMTENKIESEYEKHNSDLSKFIDEIKYELEDAELILLEACENSPLKIQRSILELLNK